MSLNFFKSREWSLEETSDGPAIVIPSPCIWPLALFFSFWLAGWAAGEVSAVKALYGLVRSAEHWAALLPGAFLVVWLAGWTAGGVFAWSIFLFSLKGREVVTLRADKLRVRLETFFGLGWSWKFPVPGMSPARVTPIPLPEGKTPPGADAAGMPPPRLAFVAIASGGKTWRLGLGLDERRAGDLLHTLSSRFGVPRER
jgi:hypothetical protein